MPKITVPTSAECIAEYETLLSEYQQRAMELTKDNSDWERINIGVAGWYEVEVAMAEMGLAGGKRTAVALRCLAGAIYAMGYDKAVEELVTGVVEGEKEN